MLAGGFDFVIHPLVVCALAAQAHDEDGTGVGAFAQRDQGVRDPLQVWRHLAAALMMQISHAALDLAADGLSHIVGAGDAGNDRHKIPGTYLSVGTDIAVKGISHLRNPPYRSPRPRRESRL